MNSTERKIIQFLEKRKNILFFIIVTLLGMAIRFEGCGFVSGDAEGYLLPWFDAIRENGGIRALGTQVGNYNIPYQFLISVMTYLPFPSLYQYKFLSSLFDFALAIASALFICELRQTKSHFVFLTAYSTIFLFPTVVLNSSVWGQCDSIYTFFSVVSLYDLYRERFTRSFLFLGLAAAFKMQAIFLLPFFLIYYVQEKSFSLLPSKPKVLQSTPPLGGGGVIFVASFYAMSLPGFLMGRSLDAPIRIYMEQSNQYALMWLNFPSFWALIGNDDENFHKLAILLTIAILGFGLYLMMNSSIRLTEPARYVTVLSWSVWTVLLFLPAMHERYSYPLDVFLIIGLFIDRTVFRYAIPAVMCSIITYGNYLCGNRVDMKLLSSIYVLTYCAYSYWVFSKLCMADTKKNLSRSNKSQSRADRVIK